MPVRGRGVPENPPIPVNPDDPNNNPYGGHIDWPAHMRQVQQGQAAPLLPFGPQGPAPGFAPPAPMPRGWMGPWGNPAPAMNLNDPANTRMDPTRGRTYQPVNIDQIDAMVAGLHGAYGGAVVGGDHWYNVIGEEPEERGWDIEDDEWRRMLMEDWNWNENEIAANEWKRGMRSDWADYFERYRPVGEQLYELNAEGDDWDEHSMMHPTQQFATAMFAMAPALLATRGWSHQGDTTAPTRRLLMQGR